jgi:hypothetical protein
VSLLKFRMKGTYDIAVHIINLVIVMALAIHHLHLQTNARHLLSQTMSHR